MGETSVVRPRGGAVREAVEGAQALARRGDLAGATAAAEAALDEGLRHPFLLNLRALRLERAGDLAGALSALEEARALQPRDAGVLNALGLLHLQAGRPAEALEALDAAVEARGDLAPFHANRGTALEASSRLADAETAFGRALALEPGQPVATAGLAALAGRRGRHDLALRLAEAALRLLPDHAGATLVAAAAETARGDAVSAEGRLRRFLRGDLAVHPRAMAEGALGDALDAQDRPAEAFAAYTAANAGLARWSAPQFDGREGAAAFTRRLAASVEALPAGALAADPAPAGPAAPDRHVFLLGFPRSGTTLLEQVLASHPQVVALEERETLIDGVRTLLSDAGDLSALQGADGAMLDAMRGAYWRRVREAGVRVEGRVFVDKHPLNTLKLPLIARLFPDATVLFARRDPRDVVLSSFRRRFALNGPMHALLTLEGAADLYDAAMTLAGRVFARSDLLWSEVVHERLVDDFDGESARACRALGLEWTPALRDFSARIAEREVATPSGAQLAGGLSREGVGTWRRYRRELAPVLPRLRPWVERFGYPAD